VVLADAATFVAAAGLAWSLRGSTAVPAAARRRPALTPLRDHRYMVVTGLSAVLAAHRSLLTLGVPLVVVTSASVPRALVPLLLTLNIAASVLLQVRAARASSTVRGAAVTFRRAGLALTLCCVALATAGRAPWPLALTLLVLAVMGQTGAELWQSAAGWEVSYALARPDQQAVYLSIYGLAVAGETVYGPAVVGAVVASGPSLGWLALGAVLAGVGLAAPWLVRWAAGDRWEGVPA
ncbi:MAG TPA: MFS transporter, partial [Candidatus Dormibacteraeota bacterium]|nr:MFS transporter [Candidatus Dormibacteraeota bacterium]